MATLQMESNLPYQTNYQTQRRKYSLKKYSSKETPY